MKAIQTITDRDQALFEAGIKFGSLYHQFVGMPLSPAGIEAAENAIEKSISAQPFVEEIKVKIDEKRVREELNDKFQYTELKGFMLDVKAVIRYQTARVHVSLKFDEKLDYPLMKIDSIEEDDF
jgi:Uncharacterized protein conserved in archaea